jgi:hypothetical protein
MNTATIDNSDAGYIERTILWQYDDAEHLKGIILGLKNFYDQSTKKHFDEMVGRMSLADENIDDYGLAVWGKILNTNRPNLTYIDEETNEKVTRSLSKVVYRKILLGKIKLFEGSATIREFAEYITSIFGDAVICTDCPDVSPPNISYPDMSLRFYLKPSATISNELNALIAQAPEVVFVYPAGVRSSGHSTSRMFVFDEQKTVDFFTPGGLDESGFNWRLTAKGNWR